MENITQNDCIIKIYECSEFYMDFKKAFHIVSAEWERQSGKKREKYYLDLNTEAYKQKMVQLNYVLCLLYYLLWSLKKKTNTSMQASLFLGKIKSYLLILRK